LILKPYEGNIVSGRYFLGEFGRSHAAQTAAHAELLMAFDGRDSP